MTADEMNNFRFAVDGLMNVYAELTNFKSRGKRATKAAEQWAKEKGKEYPALKDVAKTMANLTKSVPSAIKAWKAIDKMARDGKRLNTLALPEAKKELKGMVVKLQKTDDLAEDCLVAIQSWYKQIGFKAFGTDVDLKVMGTSYIPDYVHQFAQFKVKMNKL